MVSRSARVNDEGPRNSASARPFSGPAVSGNCASNPTMPGNCGSSICGTPPSCPIGHRAAVPGPPAAADRSGAEGMKAGTYFLDEEGRLFEGGEVAAPRGFGPVADVGKAALRPAAGRARVLLREDGAAGGQGNGVGGSVPEAALNLGEALPVEPGRGGAGAGK